MEKKCRMIYLTMVSDAQRERVTDYETPDQVLVADVRKPRNSSRHCSR